MLWVLGACERVWGLRAVQGRNNDVLSKRAGGHESEGIARVTTTVYNERLAVRVS